VGKIFNSKFSGFRQTKTESVDIPFAGSHEIANGQRSYDFGRAAILTAAIGQGRSGAGVSFFLPI